MIATSATSQKEKEPFNFHNAPKSQPKVWLTDHPKTIDSTANQIWNLNQASHLISFMGPRAYRN